MPIRLGNGPINLASSNYEEIPWYGMGNGLHSKWGQYGKGVHYLMDTFTKAGRTTSPSTGSLDPDDIDGGTAT